MITFDIRDLMTLGEKAKMGFSHHAYVLVPRPSGVTFKAILLKWLWA